MFTSIAVRDVGSHATEIVIHPSLTLAELQACLAQILSQSKSTSALAVDRISGLYRESDGKFLSLSFILNEPEAITNEVLCINPPHMADDEDEKHEEPKDPYKIRQVYHILKLLWSLAVENPVASGAIAPLFVIGLYYFVAVSKWLVILASRVTLRQAMSLIALSVDAIQFVNVVAVDTPIKEVYRYGPSIIGWEGMPINKICAQSTHYGDEDFWSKNSVECNEIYSSKERAALLLFRPVIYLALGALAYHGRKWWTSNKKSDDSVDPNMEETYKALNALVKQVQRALKSASN